MCKKVEHSTLCDCAVPPGRTGGLLPVCVYIMCILLISENTETCGWSYCSSLTVEVCQFFDVVAQVSRHGQGLSDLQVSLSDEEEGNKEKKKRGR